MTQDTGMMEGNGQPVSSFWRGAMHILGGAVAGFGSRNAGEAISRGIQVGSALQNSYIKDQQFRYGMQRQNQYDQMRSQQHELDMEYKRKRNDMMGARDADADFMSDLKTIESLSNPRRMSYKSQSMARLTAKQPTDGSVTYPIDEKEAEKIQSISKGHEVLADIDMLIYSMHEAETGQSKKAKKYADILGMKHGISIETAESGTKFIKTKFGAFPLELESASKIKALYEKDVAAQEGKLSEIWRTRHTAYSGAQKHVLNRMREAGVNLDSKDMIMRAEGYAKQIASNPIQSKTMDFAHTFNRLVKSKDKEFSEFEKAEVINKMKKAGIDFHMSDKGEPYISSKQFDDAVNRLNPGERVDVIGGNDMVKVDERLVELMYDRSGLNNLASDFVAKAKHDSSIRDKNIAEMAKQKNLFDLNQKMNTQKAAVFGDELKESRKEAKIQRDIINKKWANAEPEKIMDTFQFNSTEVEKFEENLATEMHRRFSDKSNYMKVFKEEYKSLTGKEFDPETPNSSIVSIVKESPKLQRVFERDKSTVSRISKAILRKMVRDRKPSRVKDVNDRLNAEFQAKKAEQRRINNMKAAEKKASVLDSILGDGEN